MSLNLMKSKLFRMLFLGISVSLLSLTSSASEPSLNLKEEQNESGLIKERNLNDIHTVLSEHEKVIKLLLDKQLIIEKSGLRGTQSGEDLTIGSGQLEHRLGVIESSLGLLTNEEQYFTYADWAAVAITCVAVLLTIVGLAIAALAFWGYREIRELTKSSAAKEAKSVATQTTEEMIHEVVRSELEKLINNGKLRKPLQDAVDMILRSDPNDVDKKRTEELLRELDGLDINDSEDNESSSIDEDRR